MSKKRSLAKRELGLELSRIRAEPHLADPQRLQQLCRRLGHIPAQYRQDVWQILLLGRIGGHGGDGSLRSSGASLEVEIMGTALDLENQRVVRVDVDRTRRDVPMFQSEAMREMLLQILTFHCKQTKMGYKQGMHEVLAPFVALSDPPPPLCDIYLCFEAFLERFLPFAFSKDDDFVSLQICFRLFRLLLLYHDPALCRFLDSFEMAPELFATGWFMTLFAVNVDLPTLFELWDHYLAYGDGSLHHFAVLAYVIMNADHILQSDEASLPERMCNLPRGLESLESLHALMEKARWLMHRTPESLRKILSCALYSHLEKEQLDLVLQTLQTSSCIPVSAEEVASHVLHRNPRWRLPTTDSSADIPPPPLAAALGTVADDDYPGLERGGGSSCSSSSAAASSDEESPPPLAPLVPATFPATANGGGQQPPQSSSKCAASDKAVLDGSVRGHRQFVVLDCRPKAEFERCRLAPALHLDPSLLGGQESALESKLRELLPLRGVAHLCLVGVGPGRPAGPKGRLKGSEAAVIPQDLSGEAMGLRSKRSPLPAEARAEGKGEAFPVGEPLLERGRSSSNGGTGSGMREKDVIGGSSSGVGHGNGGGGSKFEMTVSSMLRSLMGSADEISQAALPGHGGAGAVPIGSSEEDERVSRFAQLLLDADFEYVSHVRGDMPACLQALLEIGERESGASWAEGADALEGALIGTDFLPKPSANGATAKKGTLSPNGKVLLPSFRWARGEPNHGPPAAAAADSKKGGAAAGATGGAMAAAAASAASSAATGEAGDANVQPARSFMDMLPTFGVTRSRSSTSTGDFTVAGDAAVGAPQPLQQQQPQQQQQQPTSGKPAAGKATHAAAPAASSGTSPTEKGENNSSFARSFLAKVMGRANDDDDAAPAAVALTSAPVMFPITVGPAAAPAAKEATTAPPIPSGSRSRQRAAGHSSKASGENGSGRRRGGGGGRSSRHGSSGSVGKDGAPPEQHADWQWQSDAPPPRPANGKSGSSGSKSGPKAAAPHYSYADTGSTPIQTEAVGFDDWLLAEQAATGGPARVFQAHRMLGTSVMTQCRLVVSAEYITQLVEVRGWAGQVMVEERRAIPSLVRVTSRRKVPDLVVFHFRRPSAAAADAAPAVAVSNDAIAGSTPAATFTGAERRNGGGFKAEEPAITAAAAGAASQRLDNDLTLPARLPVLAVGDSSDSAAAAAAAAEDERDLEKLAFRMADHESCLRVVKDKYRQAKAAR